MNDCVVAGVGMTHFGRHEAVSLKELSHRAVHEALLDSGIEPAHVEAAVFGNAMAGLMTGQECIRGQVVLRAMRFPAIPVINVENACASGSTAFHQARALVAAGAYDVVLALGAEKLYDADKRRSFAALSSAVDVDERAAIQLANARAAGGEGRERSMFMDHYAGLARRQMRAPNHATARDFAAIASKNSLHGSLNERAQFRSVLTVEDVLAAPTIVEPLTRPMCSPIGDGAAAVVVMSERKARELGVAMPIRAVACVLASGFGWEDGPSVAARCTARAYATAGLGPRDLDAIECHDAAAPAELLLYEELGFCEPGAGPELLAEGATRIGGRIPVNPSGGLLRKGHPVGATGLAQIVELVEQLRERSGLRQVEGARTALAENGGGLLGDDNAVVCVTILTR